MEKNLEGGVMKEEAVQTRIFVLTGSREQGSAELSSYISLLRETVRSERVKTWLREQEQDAEQGLPFLGLLLRASSASSVPSKTLETGHLLESQCDVHSC